MQWTVFLEKMYASDSQGQHMPVKRIYGDEPTVDSEPTLRTGSLVVWSSLNPQSRKWERFPLLVSRVLELKYQTGAPSCEVLILGKLQYSIVFADMKQVWRCAVLFSRQSLVPHVHIGGAYGRCGFPLHDLVQAFA